MTALVYAILIMVFICALAYLKEAQTTPMYARSAGEEVFAWFALIASPIVALLYWVLP